MNDNYYYLCMACGEISPHDKWTQLRYDESGEPVAAIPGESDPIERCPICRWDHVDDSGNPGIYDGERDHLVAERRLQEADYKDGWLDRRRHTTDLAFWELFRAAGSRVHTVQAVFDGSPDDVVGYEIIHTPSGELRHRIGLREDGSLVLVLP